MDGRGTFLVLLILGYFKASQAKFVWSTGGASSLFVAIALPLDLKFEKVFLSYNFEASYDLPRTWKKKPPFLRHGNGTNDDSLLSDHHGHHEHEDFVYDDYYDDDQHSGNKHKNKNKHKHHHHDKKKKKSKPKPGSKPHKNKPKHKHKKKHKSKPKPPPKEEEDDYKDFFQGFPLDGMGDPVGRDRQRRSLLSRTKFYEIISHRFELHGLGSGDNCLLRLICEANSYQLGDLNGVLGSLVHVMFSPSSSRYEELPKRYYVAELDGRNGNCGGYRPQCEHSVLDMITQPVKNKNKVL
ncbi:uncharacterized protein LOC120444928 [Drosophila santomea]|uniref:uncharacterized protein LOC120444928 n=1 Tax=Drosophila santomea TaxID=129105 RepID=UPI0019536F23|nr:uncharacterized protein LOC120444928 [Drosophila santomea]